MVCAGVNVDAWIASCGGRYRDPDSMRVLGVREMKCPECGRKLREQEGAETEKVKLNLYDIAFINRPLVRYKCKPCRIKGEWGYSKADAKASFRKYCKRGA